MGDNGESSAAMSSLASVSRRPAMLPWALLVLAAGLALAIGLYSVYARRSFPELPPPVNDLGIISRTTEIGYSSRRDVAVLGVGILVALGAAAGSLLAWLLVARLGMALFGAPPELALRAVAIAASPAILLLPTLLRSPEGWRRRLLIMLGLLLVVALGTLWLAARESLWSFARAHPDAFGFVLGTGSVWGLCAHLYLDAARPAGYRIHVLALGPLSAVLVWWLLAATAGRLRGAAPELFLAPAAHALAPTLFIGLYPFLYFDRHPLRLPLSVALLWSGRRILRTLRHTPDPEGPTRVMTPYVGKLLLPALLLLAALDPYFRDHPQGRDMLFYAEEGQHLAWANRILAGEAPGRDFFMLYGPLMEYGHAAWLWAFGVDVGQSRAYFEALRLLGLAAALAFGRALFERRATAFCAAVVLLALSISPRVALGLLPLWAAFRVPEERRPGLAGAGALCGLLALFSQEVAVAAGLGVLAFLALEPRARRSGWLGAGRALATGAVVSVAPFLVYLAAKGALVAMVGNLVSYPRYVTLGYANAPFPALQLPPFLGPSALLSTLLTIRTPLVWYLPPVIYVAALATALLMHRAGLGGARAAGLATMGLVLFRAALGRSGPAKIVYVIPPAVLLLLLAGERAYLHARAARGGIVRAVAFGFALLVASYVVVPAVVGVADGCVRRYAHLAPASERGLVDPMAARLRGGPGPAARIGPVEAVVSLVSRAVPRGEPILAIPNDAALYFLCDRPNPTRFDLFSQIVTDDQRREVRADLERRPPRLVLLDSAITRVDGIPDERQFPQALFFLYDHYDLDRTLGRFLVLARRTTPLPPLPPPPRWDMTAAPRAIAPDHEPFTVDLAGADTRTYTRLGVRGVFATAEGSKGWLTLALETPAGVETRRASVVADGTVRGVTFDLRGPGLWPLQGPIQRLRLSVEGATGELRVVRFVGRSEP